MKNKAQKRLIMFAVKYPDTWQSYATDKQTVSVVCATANLGIIRLNEFGQFMLKSRSHAAQWLLSNYGMEWSN